MTSRLALREAHDSLIDVVTAALRIGETPSSRAALAVEVDAIAAEHCIRLQGIDRRNLVTMLMRSLEQTAPDLLNAAKANGRATIEKARHRIQPILMERLDAVAATKMERAELGPQVSDLVGEILVEERLQLNRAEQDGLVELLLD